MVHSVEIDLSGRKVSIETGKMAKQANGSVVVRSGDNVVIVSACSAPDPKVGASFFPLTVDYREYTYAAGKFPGGFIKREGRPSEKETLTCRLIDRPIRPLFPEGYQHETQIICMVVSAEKEADPSPLAMIGTAAALAISDIPFHHFMAALRVALVNGQMVALPSYAETKEATVSIVVAGTESGIVMVESGAKQATEAQVCDALEFGHECCKKIAGAIRELTAKCGKKKREFTPEPVNQAMLTKLSAALRDELQDAMNTQKYPKLDSYAKVDACKKKAKAMFESDEDKASAGDLFDRLKEQIFRDEMLKLRRRPDGRKFDEIRNLDIEVGVLPRTHGSSLFTRGETQALVTMTLGTEDDQQRIEMLDPTETAKRFMLHYNFPPFSVGETGRYTGPGRREIGHGALAERALSAVLPDIKDFPYTLRIVSDILESNGSSSMASVCGGSLALMDAAVPISAPVAGIAMGMVKEGDAYAILTDIAGAEDHYGDMDFKVAGTEKGITALQMDLKVPNVSVSLMREALEQARRARLFLLEKMNAVLAAPRTTMSQYAPRIFTMQVPIDKIREIIGPGGKMIRSIVDQTGCKIDINDDGSVNIFATEGPAAELAMQLIGDIAAVAEVGKTYLGKVVKIADFGAFVEIFNGTTGLLHISEIAESRIKEVRDALKEGDQIMVKVLALEGNKIKLSRKAVLLEQRDKRGKGDGSKPASSE